MCNGNWGDREKISYFVGVDRFRDENNNICEESVHYFCDNLKSSWPLALVHIRKHFKSRQREFMEKYARKLTNIIVYSDNGEFKCTAFLYKVAQIAEELNMTVNWNFTCPGHGKGKHDGEGHVGKTECRSAVIGGHIQYSTAVEPYS